MMPLNPPAAVPPEWWQKLWQRLQPPTPGRVLGMGSADWSALERDGWEVLATLGPSTDALITLGADWRHAAASLRDGGGFLIGVPAFPEDIAGWRHTLEEAFEATVHLIDPEPTCDWLFAFGWKGSRFSVALSVLMVTHHRALKVYGGGETQLFETLRHLRALGIRADVSLSLRFPEDTYDLAHVFSLHHEEKLAKLVQLHLPIVTSTIFWDYSEVRYVDALIRSVFTQTDPAEVSDALEAWRHQNLELDGVSPEAAADPADLRHIQRQVLQHSRILLPNARKEAEVLRRCFGNALAPICVVPNAVRQDRFQAPSAEAFIQRFGLQDFILCTARLETNKNQLMLIWALQDTGLPLVLAGPESFAGYAELCRRWAGPNVHFVGELSPDLLASAYAAARVHALPSWSETPGLANLEAGLAGCALVVGNRGTETEYLGPYAQVCDPGDWQSIREAVLAAWAETDPARREARRAHLREHYGWDQTARITAQAYAAALSIDQPDSGRIRGVWEGGQFSHHSLAYVNRELELALLATGQVDLAIRSSGPPQFDETEDPRFLLLKQRMERSFAEVPDFHLRHQFPPNFEPPAEGHWIMIQPWEFGGLPQAWVAPMTRAVDEIWVPTRFVKDCYVSSGISPNKVHVVPNGVDTQLFTPEGPKATLPTQKTFKFLYVGGTILRKGVDILVSSYLDAFTAEDDVCLIIKDFCVQSVYSETNLASSIQEAQQRPNAPEIIYLNADLPGEELAALYRACDALVHPYRGEGFGLPIAEAMACGLPVLVPNYGACLDFCDPETAILVPAKLVSLPQLQDPPACEAGYWVSEVQNEDLVHAMREAARTPERGRAIGARASERIRREFTWQRAAQVALTRLKALQDKPILRFQPDFADPLHFRPSLTPLDIEGLRRLNFLAFPTWTVTDLTAILTPYLQAFTPHDEVALVLRLDPKSGITSEQAQESLLQTLDQLGVVPEDAPDILLIDIPLTSEREGALFASCQALVSTEDVRFDRKAAACGLPIFRHPTASDLRQNVAARNLSV